MAVKAKASSPAAAGELTPRQRKRKENLKLVKRNYQLYFFLIPAVVFIAVFMYFPLYGLQIAFKNYRSGLGIWGSEWVGLKWFEQFFNSPNFSMLLANTLIISIYSLVVSFPFPIILALILNYVKNLRFKKFAQTVTYMPYFISTVVLVGTMKNIFSPRTGLINNIIALFGGPQTDFMGNPDLFRTMYVWSGVWQGIAALANVDSAQVEASLMDGAGRFARVWHVDLPAILPTIVIQLILAVGSVMSLGYEKVFLMQNPVNTEVSEVISTFVYKRGIAGFQYSYAAAVGLFNSVVNLVLIALANVFAKKVGETSLW